MKPIVFLCAIIAVGRALTAADLPPSESNKEPQSLERLLATVPADVSLKRGSKPDPVAIALANASLKQVIGQQATFDITVEKVTTTHSAQQPIVIQSRPNPATVGRTKVPSTIYSYILAQELPTIAKAKKGTLLTVTGRIVKAEINAEPAVVIDLMDSTVKSRSSP